ncbi:MAG TPA: energy transducer TonB [Sphingomicrobium sp.]|nr:energy transducer TonB [Sphingomicrobium sp.]
MLAYAANSPRAAGRSGSPRTLVLILAGHAALIAAVLTAKPGIVSVLPFDPTDVINIPVDPPPPPPPQPTVEPRPTPPATQPTFIEKPAPIVPMEQPTTFQLDTGPTIADIGAVIGSGPTTILGPPRKDPVRIGPRFATSENAIKPPYPSDKLRDQEEATLKLRLTIDARGRVTAVEPVGAADPSFLAAARRHILRAWRYKPATEDGVAVATSTVITLSFRLEDV